MNSDPQILIDFDFIIKFNISYFNVSSAKRSQQGWNPSCSWYLWHIQICFYWYISQILNRLAIYIVEAGHQGLIFSRFTGLRPDIFREGWHLRIPYFEIPVIYDVRTKPRVIQTITSNRGNKYLICNEFTNTLSK